MLPGCFAAAFCQKKMQGFGEFGNSVIWEHHIVTWNLWDPGLAKGVTLSLSISLISYLILSLVFPGQYVVPSDKHYASGCKLQMLQLTLRYSSAGPRGSELSELTVLADSRCCVECVFCAERWARSA